MLKEFAERFLPIVWAILLGVVAGVYAERSRKESRAILRPPPIERSSERNVEWQGCN